MRKVVVIVMVLALVLTVFSAAASAKSDARPFKGFLTGEVKFTPGDTEDPPLPPNTNPPGLYTISNAVGNASHLGRTAMYSYHPTPTGNDIGPGFMTLFAANGDQIYVEYYGSAPFPEGEDPYWLEVDCTFTITDGTGRFEDATGSGDMTAWVLYPGFLGGPDPWEAYWTWTGTIGY